MSSRLNRVFKCLGCECELDDTVYGAYCNRCLNYDDSDIPELVSREEIFSKINKETEETCATITSLTGATTALTCATTALTCATTALTCAVCNKNDQLNELCLCNKCYKEHLHFAVDESEDVEDSDSDIGEQDLIDAQHALNDNDEYTEEENAEYFRLNPQPPLERRCCETLKEETHR